MPLFSRPDLEGIPDISDRLSYPSLILSIVTPLFVLFRFASRLHFLGRIGPDDWVILASVVLSEIVCIQMMIVCRWAFGKHADDVPQLVPKTLKAYFVAQILYKINIGLTKISILLLYLRIFIQHWFMLTCWVWIGIIVAFTTGTVMSSVFQCTPIEYAFDKDISGKCINLTAFWFANAVFNIISDLVIISLPLPVISSLHLPRKSKFALSGVFAVGIFVCVTSVLRITTLDIATSYLDITWNSIASSMWTVIESSLGIICACLSALARPLSKLFPSVFGGLRTGGTEIGGTATTEGRNATRDTQTRVDVSDGVQNGIPRDRGLLDIGEACSNRDHSIREVWDGDERVVETTEFPTQHSSGERTSNPIEWGIELDEAIKQ